MDRTVHLGMDIGSISINTILMDEGMNILENHYHFCHGKPFHLLKELLTDILKNHPQETIKNLAFTGTGGELAAELLGGYFVNEIIKKIEKYTGLSLLNSTAPWEEKFNLFVFTPRNSDYV